MVFALCQKMAHSSAQPPTNLSLAILRIDQQAWKVTVGVGTGDDIHQLLTLKQLGLETLCNITKVDGKARRTICHVGEMCESSSPLFKRHTSHAAKDANLQMSLRADALLQRREIFKSCPHSLLGALANSTGHYKHDISLSGGMERKGKWR